VYYHNHKILFSCLANALNADISHTCGVTLCLTPHEISRMVCGSQKQKLYWASYLVRFILDRNRAEVKLPDNV